MKNQIGNSYSEYRNYEFDFIKRGDDTKRMNQPIQITRVVRGKQQTYLRKPWSHTHFKAMQCRLCNSPLQPWSGATRYCEKCKTIAAQQSKERRDKKAKATWQQIRKAQLESLGPMQCWYCGRSFWPTQIHSQITCEACRGKSKGKANGQADTFRVEGMLVAEFAFYIIMLERGIQLEYVGSSGAWFKLGSTHFRPDFRTPGGNTYYEVVGSRQRYHQAKDKYRQFRKLYPELQLFVVRPDGTEIFIDK